MLFAIESKYKANIIPFCTKGFILLWNKNCSFRLFIFFDKQRKISGLSFPVQKI